ARVGRRRVAPAGVGTAPAEGGGVDLVAGASSDIAFRAAVYFATLLAGSLIGYGVAIRPRRRGALQERRRRS
ncbi:MAG: hypothetical protein ACRDF0_05075, partial [Candidatus Limnocylindria bacterium]